VPSFYLQDLFLVTNIADIMLTYVNQQSIHHYALKAFDKGKIAMSTADIVEHSHSLKRLDINYLLFYVDYKDFNPVSIQLSHAKNERQYANQLISYERPLTRTLQKV